LTHHPVAQVDHQLNPNAMGMTVHMLHTSQVSTLLMASLPLKHIVPQLKILIYLPMIKPWPMKSISKIG
jgi:hypothetical protein